MRKIGQTILALGLVLTSLKASALESSGSAAFTTDYVFRGQSQTLEKPAVQAGLDLSSDSGFYVSLWGSSVDFGGPAQAEIDLIAGYATDLSENLALDVGYIYYSYSNESDLNYHEVFGSLGFYGLTLGLNYSNEYLGKGGEPFVYTFASYDLELGAVTLTAHAAYNKADRMDITWDGTNDDNYAEWALKGAVNGFGLDFELTYHGTSIKKANPLGDDRLVLTVSRSF